MSGWSPRSLGLTGGIACGKTVVSDLLAKEGFSVIDTDQIAREVVAPGEAGYKKVIDAFGQEILNRDRTIHRARLGKLVFSNPEKRILLNQLLHPIIRERWQHRRAEQTEQFPDTPVVVVIPLLYETGCESFFDCVVCVACSRAVQERRLSDRGHDMESIEKRISSQWSVEEKMARADQLIWNDGTVELLREQVGNLAARWCQGTGKE